MFFTQTAIQFRKNLSECVLVRRWVGNLRYESYSLHGTTLERRVRVLWYLSLDVDLSQDGFTPRNLIECVCNFTCGGLRAMATGRF